MKLVLNTQYKENYAAHDESYVHGVSAPYWKFKGGDTYVVTRSDLPSDIEGFVEELKGLVEYSDEGSMTYLLDWNIMDNTQEVCEDWETPVDCYKVNGRWVAMKRTDNRDHGWRRREILQVEETWDMLPDAGRDNYKIEYLMEDGDLIIGHKGLTEWFAAQEVAA